jgi:hypothetical protein
MTTKATIISGINAKVGNTAYTAWRIGLTHDLVERKGYWGTTKGQNVSHWASWTADSLSEAQVCRATIKVRQQRQSG